MSTAQPGYRNTAISTSLDQARHFTVVNIQPDHISETNRARIAKLVDMKDRKWLREHGGINGLYSTLGTHVDHGVHGNKSNLTIRRRIFGSNMYGENQHAKNFYHHMLEALKDPMNLILLVCAILSIIFHISKHGAERGWLQGATKLAATLVVITVSAGSNFWPGKICHNLSEFSSKIHQVDVLRSGQWQRVPIPEIVVGDIVFLIPGDQVPADGLCLDNTTIQVDKFKTDGQTERTVVDGSDNPFLVSGTNVVHGYARMLVTAVGKNFKSQTINLDGEVIYQFENLTSIIGKAGDLVAFIIFLVLLVRLFAGNIYNEGTQLAVVGEPNFLDILIAMVGILAAPAMIAITSTPKGLLLAAKIALAYSMKKMKNADVLLRKPSLCHAIGSVTNICTNGTGSLTMDSKEVTRFCLGLSSIEEPFSMVSQNVQELLCQGIGLNISHPPSRYLSEPPLKTEKAIFDWAIQELRMDVEALHQRYQIVEIEYFDPEKKQSGVLIRKYDDETFHLHRKGAPEVILSMCSQYYASTGLVKSINEYEKVLLEKTIEGMARDGLRCIAFAHKQTSMKELFTSCQPQLILLGIMGLRSSLRPGVTKAVNDCLRAGVNLKMITGDSMLTAKAVATECGILDIDNPQNGEIIEGSDFRNYTPEERMEKVDNIRVIARATPSEKLLMVQCLKEKNHVVAVIGRGIGDVHALREANIGICFSMKSADIARAYSDIVIQNEEIPSVVNIMKWGRGIYDNIQIYTQFLLTASFVALIVDSMIAVTAREPNGVDAVTLILTGESPYALLQLTWLKLIMGTLAALALIVYEAPEELMQKPPRERNEPLINHIMWRNIIAQTLYQIATLLAIHFKGKSMFDVNNKVKRTMIYNTYVLCQVFNMFNTRSLEKSFFKEIQKKKLFWGITSTIVAFQALMVEVLESYADTARLDMGQWSICIAIAALSWPIGRLVKCIPFSNVKWQTLKTKID
ncbi:hypothetical protein RJ639_001348 [Escallonia herrerae]|uniref:Calcium-transporting ATPase n=1 Tax=Escallonia herrerae TaxID=1293975 RepID=A0AA88X9E4_9ASTE|nr:hypothetical protein RJ639_001348 [Escallonia herrerae]